MRAASRIPTLMLVVAASVAGAVLWQARAAQDPAGEAASPIGLAATETLGGPDRYLTHLSTDKPIYRPGEIVYMRGVILHQATRQPLPGDQPEQALVEIRGPKGDRIASGWVPSEDSVLGYQWTIPDEQAGGEYTVHIAYPMSGQPPAERKFDIRVYRAPRLKSQIKFLRDGYGPGDEVVATLDVQRAEGGAPAGAPVTVIARVDGDEAYRGSASVDDSGRCIVRFPLPTEIRRGEGTLALVIEDGGVVETASKTIPILLQTVDLTMYPEGGELVAGLRNRVYFEAFTPARKPADLAGEVHDADGRRVAIFRSEHEGRGRFEFTPKVGGSYELSITEPSGINTRYPLPDVKPGGVVLQSLRDVQQAGRPMRLLIGSTVKQRLTVTVSRRERVLVRESLDFDDGQSKKIRLSVPEDADGVLVMTVWNSEGKPLAERLIYREPAESVRVEVTAENAPYIPGGKARLTVRTMDGKGQPVSAVVGVTVTDDSVLEMIERREQAPRLPVMVMLEDEVRELADAHVYLDPENLLAETAVDLLLGTQGWRRFAFVDPTKLLAEHGDKARRALALRLPVAPFAFGGLGFPGEEKSDARRRFDAFGDRNGLELDRAAEGVLKVNEERLPQLAAAVAPPEADMPAAEPMPAVELAEEQADLAGRELHDRQPVERPMGFAQQAGLAEAASRAEAAEEAEMLMPLGSRPMVVGNDFVAVRVYAHQVRPDRQPGQRSDFTETLFWHAGIRTNDDGQANMEFGLNDSVTSFRVMADAFSATGVLGSGTAKIESVEPFYVEPKLPLELTMGDRVDIPVAMVNATGQPLNVALNVEAESLNVDRPVLGPLALAPGQRQRELIRMGVGDFQGQATITLSATAAPYADRVTRSIAVKPLGFPAERGVGGLIAAGGMARHELTIPDDLVAGSLNCRVVVYPTPLASMTEALERLIQEPCGCFEQTSSTVYPLVMAQQYFLSHQGVDPSLIERSSAVLETGYQRLSGYECPGGGFEWWGADPGHDALTAYGLMEFTDMAQVRHVEPELLDRTQNWLVAQRDGRGGYARVTHTYHTWLAEPEIAFPYNTWGLLSAGVREDLSREVAWVRDAAEKTQNTYVMALGANVLALAGDQEGTNHLLDRLAGKQTDDGSLDGAITSVVGSGGEALTIETTALAALAWLQNSRYAANVEESIRYLAESCKAGRFGSTQSTVLALRAIIAYDQSRARPKAPGSLQLVVDGHPVGAPVAFAADRQGAIELPDASGLLSSGKHMVQLAMTGGSEMPYSLAIDFNRLQPDSSPDCNLHLETRLRDETVEEGEATEAEVTVINRTGETVPTPLAIVGIPGGLEVRHDQLKELVKEGRIAAYEVLGREVVLYWRALKPEERVDVALSLIAAVPGSYTAPASRAYLYYTDEHKRWTPGMKATIRPGATE